MPGPSRQQTVSIRATRLLSSTWPSTIGFSGRSRQHLRPRPQVSGPLMMLRLMWRGARQLGMPDECAKSGAQLPRPKIRRHRPPTQNACRQEARPPAQTRRTKTHTCFHGTYPWPIAKSEQFHGGNSWQRRRP